MDRDKAHNEKNLGLGLRYEVSRDWSAVGGYYRNSVERTTYYLAFPYLPIGNDYVRVGVVPGVLAGGYRIPWAPYALPSVRFQVWGVAANVIYAPRWEGKGTEEVVWLNFEFRWRR